MHLGLYHEPVRAVAGGYETYGAFARYVMGFARHFERVTVFAPTTANETYFSGCAIDSPNITVVPLPFFMTHIQAIKKAPTIIRAFRRHCNQLDVINARATAPLAYVLWWLTRKRDVPFIYHFASDPFEVLRSSPKYRGLIGRLAISAYHCEFSIQKYIVARNYAFASGQAIADRLCRHSDNVESLITSSLQPEDYFQRSDTCAASPVRLLFVGYLRREKGVDDLIRALKILRDGGLNVILDVVGQGEHRGTLEEIARSLNLSNHVNFRGFVVMGPELNQFYNQADIFALPSLSEGSPKVVLEALAHSLPVVASPVGNIPQMLDDGRRGILVAPGNPSALAEGISRLIADSDFRRTCIRNGYLFSKAHSADAFICRMAQKMKELANRRQERSTP